MITTHVDDNGSGVFIAGHRHRDPYSTQRGWHLVDISNCSRDPLGYHLLDLSPTALMISSMSVKVELTSPLPADCQGDGAVYPLQIPV